MALLDISSQTGMSVWLILIITIWETVWTALAMWRSAKSRHLFWFIIFLVINLFGIPEIIYMIVTRKKTSRKPVRRKRR